MCGPTCPGTKVPNLKLLIYLLIHFLIHLYLDCWLLIFFSLKTHLQIEEVHFQECIRLVQ